MVETIVEKGYHQTDAEAPNWEVGKKGFSEGYEYPQAGYNYRIAIGNEVIEKPEDAEVIEEILATPLSLHHHDGAITKNMVRVIMTEKALRKLPPQLIKNLETVIDLSQSGNPYVSDCLQLIFGHGHLIRQPLSTDDSVRKELEDAKRSFAQSHYKENNGIPSGYWVERLNSRQEHRRLVVSYEQLLIAQLGDSEIRELLSDEHAVIIVGGKHHYSVAGGIYAWRDVTQMTRNGESFPFNTYEVEGAVVSPRHRELGLYSAIATALYEELAQRTEQIDLVFAFSRATETGSLRGLARTGHISSIETAEGFGLKTGISRGMDFIDELFVDDVVTYIPGRMLKERFGSQGNPKG